MCNRGIVRSAIALLYMMLLLVGAALWMLWSPAVAAHARAPAVPHAALHAVLVRSEPAAGAVLPAEPGVVRLWFSEPVQPVSTGIVVLDPAGRRLSRGVAQANGVTLSASLAPAGEGTYFVRWQVISSDTHPLEGQLSFSVGHPSRGAEGFDGNAGGSSLGLALQVVARWLHFAGYALGFGTLAFGLVVLRPLGIVTQGNSERQLKWLVSGGIALLLVAELVALLAQVISLGAGSSFAPSATEIAGDALASGFGRVLSQRLGAALLLWVIVGIGESLGASAEDEAKEQSQAGASGGREQRIPLIVAMVVGLALAVVDGEASHAVNVEPVWFGLTVNALHLAAMGLWLGGLLALLAIWDAKELRGRRGAVVARFGGIAVSALVILGITGAVMAWEQIQRLPNLIATAYGRTLIAKVLAVAGVLLLAFVATRAREERRSRWWTLEAVGVMVVLALAGLLASLPPPV